MALFSSHSGVLTTHEFSSGVSWRPEVCVLVCLRAFLSPAHLSLIERVAGRDGIFVSGHRNNLAFFEHRATHCLLSLLATRRRIDHLL